MLVHPIRDILIPVVLSDHLIGLMSPKLALEVLTWLCGHRANHSGSCDPKAALRVVGKGQIVLQSAKWFIPIKVNRHGWIESQLDLKQ